MKFLFSVLLSCTMFIGMAQNSTKAPSPGTTSCVCQAGYTVCQADALFMSCCTCCQPGSSCGSWSAFGLCGCKCENTSAASGGSWKSEVKFLPNKYNAFMDYLDRNGIASTKFRDYAAKALAGSVIHKTDNPDNDYVILSGDVSALFSDAYVADMKELIKDAKTTQILDFYLNPKK